MVDWAVYEMIPLASSIECLITGSGFEKRVDWEVMGADLTNETDTARTGSNCST